MRFRFIHTFVIVLMTFLVVSECFSQDLVISGRVIDDDSRKPISGIKVKIKGVNRVALTDVNGSYSLVVPKCISQIKFVEFPTKKISSLEKISDNLINIYLSNFSSEEIYALTLKELMDIKISVASKTKESINEAPGVVSVISEKEIEKFGASNLRDVLERVPSIIGLTSFANRNVISMRGDQVANTNSHILITINGRPSREVVLGGADSDVYAMYPLNCIKQIEVIRGPGSVLYGSNAYSGIINIITKYDEEFFSASVEGGYPNGNIYSVSLGTKLGNGIVSASIQYKRLPDWRQTFTIASGDIVSFNTHEEGIGTNLSYHHGGFMLNTNFLSWDTFLLAPLAGGDVGNYSRYFTDMGYTHQFSEKVKSSLNITHTNTNYKGRPPHPTRKSNDIILESTTFFQLNNSANIVTGGLVNYLFGSEKRQILDGSTITALPWKEAMHYSFYGQLDYELLSSLKLIGGFQLHKNLNGKLPVVVPRLGLIWKPKERILMKVLYGSAYRTPSLNEMFIDDPRLKGNSDLTAEQINTINLEFVYRYEKFHSSISLYRSLQNNIISRDTNISPSSFINQGEFSISGVEYEVKFIPTSNLYFTGSCLYQANKLTNEGVIVENSTTSPFVAKLGFSYTTTFGLQIGLFDI